MSTDLADFHGRLAALPPSHIRRIGLLMLQAGAVGMLVSMPLGIAAANIALAIAMAGALLAGAPLQRMPGFRWSLAFAGWIALSVAVAIADGRARPPPADHYGELVTWLALPCCLVAFHRASIPRWGLRAVSWVLAAGAILAAIQFGLGWSPHGMLHLQPGNGRFGKVGGFHANPLSMGAVATLLILCLVRAQGAGRIDTVSRVAGMAGAAVLLVLSFSRLAWLGMAAGVFALVALRGRRHLFRAALLAGAILGLAAGILALAMPRLLRSMASLNDGRIYIWRVTLQIIRRHPLFGTGTQARFQHDYAVLWPSVVGPFPHTVTEPTVNHAHNSLLVLASEHGVPAALLYVGLVTALVLFCLRHYRRSPPDGRLAMALTVSWVICGMFENMASQTGSAVAFFATMALAMTWICGDASGRTPAADAVPEVTMPAMPVPAPDQFETPTPTSR